MIDAAQPAPVRWCREQFREDGQFEGRSIMTVGEVLGAAERSRTAPRDVNHKWAAAALEAEGFIKGEKLRVRLGKEVLRLWIRDRSSLVAQLSPAQLKERYQAERGDTTQSEEFA
jgi:hypothetical protein